MGGRLICSSCPFILLSLHCQQNPSLMGQHNELSIVTHVLPTVYHLSFFCLVPICCLDHPLGSPSIVMTVFCCPSFVINACLLATFCYIWLLTTHILPQSPICFTQDKPQSLKITCDSIVPVLLPKSAYFQDARKKLSGKLKKKKNLPLP